jgi:hypothetical protein
LRTNIAAAVAASLSSPPPPLNERDSYMRSVRFPKLLKQEAQYIATTGMMYDVQLRWK